MLLLLHHPNLLIIPDLVEGSQKPSSATKVQDTLSRAELFSGLFMNVYLPPLRILCFQGWGSPLGSFGVKPAVFQELSGCPEYHREQDNIFTLMEIRFQWGNK